MKPILMIHEMNEAMFDLPLENYILTFDDGLVTPLKYIDELIKLDTLKIFFISTNIVCPEEIEQDMSFTVCKEAHINAACGDYSNYLKWSQIKMLNTFHNFEIGGHGHNHLKLWETKGLRERFTLINQDCKKMFSEFKRHNIKIDSYCFPYNYRDELCSGIVKKNGVTEIYDGSRKAIEDLI